MPPKASTSAPSSSKATGSGSTGKVAAASSTKGKAATSGSSTSGNAKASSSTSKKPAASTSKAAAANGASGSGSGSPAGSVRMTSLEHRIHQHALAANKQTLTYAELQAIEGVPEDGDALTEIINKMLRKHLLKVQKTPRGESVFVAQSMAQAREYGAMDPHDKLCLDCITSGGNQGMWTRTLKARTNLHQNLMAKALKNLEQRKLIKQVKSVKYPTRKIYMNSNVIPSIDLTGGPWYSKDGALDIEFIDALHRACKNYIKSKSFPDGKPNLQWPRSHDPYLPTANDVLEFLTVKQVIRDVELAVEHIELILNALVYDGEIERIWCRRYDADGREYAIDPAPAGLADSNGAGTKRKKGGQGGGSKKKKRRGDSADIDADSDDTGAGSSSGSGGDEDEEDAYSEPDFDYQLPPALNGKGRKNGFRDEPAEKPHPRPGPAGNAWYWVYKTRLTGISNGSSKDPATGETVYHFPDPFDLGYTQSPCGICPVASFCNNKGTPRVLPLPGEKDLTNDGETGWEEWRTSSSVSQRVQIKDVPGKSKGKFNPNANRSDPKERMKALLKMKVPAGGGEFEDADGKWKGGGKVGGKVIAPVNPSNCLYYSSWFGEEIDW